MPKTGSYQLTNFGDFFFENHEGFTEVELLVVCLGWVEVIGKRASQGELGRSNTLGKEGLEILDHIYLSLDSK